MRTRAMQQGTREPSNDGTTQGREKLIIDVAYDKASENYIEDMMYCRMHNTQSCWRGNPDVVAINLSQITTDAASS